MPVETPEDHIFRSTEFLGVIEDAIKFFVTSPICILPPSVAFKGAGVYALYYDGDFPLYERLVQLSGSEYQIPIYVGKTVPPGWRKNRALNKPNTVLRTRFLQHARTIKQVSNLKIEDFKCRYVILTGTESDLIGGLESGLIRKFSPIWNSYLEGFGNHDVGKKRYSGKYMEWDTLHPGREWATKMTGETRSIEPIQKRITDVLNQLQLP